MDINTPEYIQSAEAISPSPVLMANIQEEFYDWQRSAQPSMLQPVMYHAAAIERKRQAVLELRDARAACQEDAVPVTFFDEWLLSPKSHTMDHPVLYDAAAIEMKQEGCPKKTTFEGHAAHGIKAPSCPR